MKEDFDQFLKRIHEFLAAHAEDPEPDPSVYACPRCRDTGWIRTFTPEGYSESSVCSCVRARGARKLIERSGLGDSLENETFEAFHAVLPWQQTMKELAERYAKALIEGIRAAAAKDGETVRQGETRGGRMPWLYLGGNPGSGKTHLCTAVCGELLKARIPVVYMQWSREARELKSVVNEPEYRDRIDRFIRAEVLYIDDLFKQRQQRFCTPTDADIRLAFELINARYLENRPTLISGEWELEGELVPVDEGTFSRVVERCRGYCFTVPRARENNYRLSIPAESAEGAAENGPGDPAEEDRTEEGNAAVTPASAPLFSCPSDVSEVEHWAREQGLHLDSRRFFNYYRERGWYMQGAPIRDWHAVAKSWRPEAEPKPTV